MSAIASAGAVEITMPRLSDSMEEGTILRWLKADGDRVEAGDALAEIETDKAVAVYEAEVGGTVRIVVPEGGSARLGETIAFVGDGAGPVGAGPSPSPEPRNAAAPARPTRIAATPVARRIAAAAGVDLAAVTGTGPNGRIVRWDVARAAQSAADAAPAAPVPAPAVSPLATAPDPSASGRGDVTTQSLSRLQQTVARRMTESKTTVPHFQIQTEVVMDPVLELRDRVKDLGEPAPSVNDFVVKASALALARHPRANAAYRDGSFALFSRVNVGIAVAAADALVVPAIADADQKPVGRIATEARELARRVRDGSIQATELSGATFTVSNLGMFGMTAIWPVIDVPQAAILGVGATRAVLARDTLGEIVDRQVMTLTLSCDHRILYGADAAAFLSSIRELLEQPLRLLL